MLFKLFKTKFFYFLPLILITQTLIADETVNTSEVIDRNEFIANIFIKPARSINFVTLNFVAVRTGVSFEEIVGTAGV